MQSNAELTTQFAPATRAPDHDILRQAAYFSQLTLTHYLLDTVPDAYLILEGHRQIVFANQAMLDIVGEENIDAVVGARPGEALNCEHANKNAAGCGTSEFCRNCGAVKAILNGFQNTKDVQDCRITQTNGDALDLRVWTTPLVVEETPYCVFAVKDISHEKRRQALERTFFHDIMNTVSIISGYSQILTENPADAEIVAGELNCAIDRLSGEISAHRDLVAAENGDLSVRLNPIKPQDLLREIQALYEQHPSACNKTILIDATPDNFYLVSDRVLLGRVIGNMVKNALEAIPSGSTVTLSYTVQDERITFSIHNPTFIPRHIQLQIFQRSFSTKGPGRGLGTYSMKLLSERYLDGEVGFESSKNEGTTFYATYPLMSEHT